MSKFEAYSIFLEKETVTRKDLMFGAVYIQELIKVEDGYLVKLHG